MILTASVRPNAALNVRSNTAAAFASWWTGAVRPAWTIIVSVAACVTIGCIAGPFEYARVSETSARVGLVSALMTCAVILAHSGMARLSLVTESFALTTATAFTVPALTSMIAVYGMPYQDEALLAVGLALGFDWPAIVEWFGARPQLSMVLSHVYESLLWQPAVLLPLLAFLDPERLRRVLAASTIALLATVVVFAFVPARTGYGHLGYTPEQFPGMLTNTAWGVTEILDGLRDGERQLSLEGLITFPSFHAVAAALFAYAWMAVPLLRWPFAILNILMIVSCVPIGSHYVVDVLAGIVLAFAAYKAANRYFARTDRRAPLPGWREAPEGADLIGTIDSVRGAVWRGLAWRATRA